MVRSSYWLIYWLIDWKAVAPFNATSQLGEAYRVSQPAPGNSLLSDRQLGMLDEVVREKDEFIARFVHLFIRKRLSWTKPFKNIWIYWMLGRAKFIFYCRCLAALQTAPNLPPPSQPSSSLIPMEVPSALLRKAQADNACLRTKIQVHFVLIIINYLQQM